MDGRTDPADAQTIIIRTVRIFIGEAGSGGFVGWFGHSHWQWLHQWSWRLWLVPAFIALLRGNLGFHGDGHGHGLFQQETIEQGVVMKQVGALICGWVFAIGLGVSGMTKPAKVIGFLDVTGDWDPSLMLVMGGAVLLGLITFPWVLKRGVPIFGERFILTEKAGVDASLLWGAALFGMGWGLSGYCPGPALVSVVTGNLAVIVFVIAMIAGLGIGQWWIMKK